MWQEIKNYYHLGQAIIANYFYGFPARKLVIIGVTGTDGKTTTTSLIYHILKSSDKRVAMITSVGAYIGDKVYDIGFHVTTPSPFGLQKYIKQAVDAGMEYLVLETTSHALDQNRVWGIPYAIGVLTNITHEHLDYHKSYIQYASAKFKLLRIAHTSVVNLDDESYQLIAPKLTQERKHLITFSLKNQKADLTPQKFPFKSKLIGKFNIQNNLAAIGVCRALGIPDSEIKAALPIFQPPPGRQEIIYDKEFRVMIDFAHTPNAFDVILPEVKKFTKGRLIHVFGAAGKRDFTKRPEMGKAAADYDDIIILTAEDPRDEQVEVINDSIIEGIKMAGGGWRMADKKNKQDAGKLYFEIDDRKTAISFAINTAKKDDTVILTGKSHEKSMNLGHGEEPWDEFDEAEKAIVMRRK
jgi:UDP-N-acetylmuramoyl-L-alanyl-D-glutamate--2,6-diaminopimelate ligase